MSNTNIPATIFQDPFSEEVWKTTYKDHNDSSIDDTFKRIAEFAAGAEATPQLKQLWATRFFDMFSQFKCTSGGRIYANAGTEWGGTTLLNCFVSPRASSDIDSLTAIIEDVSNQALTLKSEGGWGQNFSFLRPRGAFIHGIGVESPGAVKYMEIYDKVSDVITSGSGKKSTNKKAKAKIRKGAMMGVLDVWHPDILEFIRAKQQPGRLAKFNVSVNCTDPFMTRVLTIKNIFQEASEEAGIDITTPEELKNNELVTVELKDMFNMVDEWDLIFPDTTHERYKAEWSGDIKVWQSNGYPVDVYHTTSVWSLWEMIMASTYRRAEPGVLFLDRANYYGPLNYKETIMATNPCGEQTLAPGGVCNLGSINLTQFVLEDGTGFDLDKIKIYVRYLNRFLDNINDLSNAPLPEYVDSMRNKRRVGIGVLGWGSALFMLRVRFGSARAGELREQMMSTIAQEAYMSSIDLAEEKGMFSACDPELHANGAFVQNLNLPPYYIEKMKKVGIRNSSLLSVQPTGNTSILANVVSGGLEPIFMPEYIRTVIVNAVPDEIADICPKWYEGEWTETELFKTAKEGDEEILKGTFNGTVYKIDKNRGLTKEVLCRDYGVRWLDERGLWDSTADWAVTTTELTVDDHLSDLTGFTRWIDSAASKTINVPNDYPYEKFKDIYLDAFKSGYVKGVTTYRAGTMTTVLAAKDETGAEDEEIIVDDVRIPNKGPASYSVMRAEGHKWYLTTIMDENNVRPAALFVHTNAREPNISTSDAVEKLLQLARDKKIPERWVADTENKIKSDNNSTKIARCISLNLRHGVLIKNIVAVLENVDNVFVGTFLFQIKKYLMTWIKDGEKVNNGDCPQCGSHDSFAYSEGCIKCVVCGWSRC